MLVESAVHEDKMLSKNRFNVSIDGLSPKLNNKLGNIIAKEGYRNYHVVNRIITTKGDNYLGELYKIDITGETANGSKETNIFLKIIPKECHLNAISVQAAYQSEMFAYNDLQKIYNDVQNEAKVPIDERFRMVNSYDETDEDTIILENIMKKGYRSLHRLDVISLQAAEIAVKQFAKFHSLSFVVRERRPDYFETTIKNIKSPLIFDENWQEMVKILRDNSINYFNEDLKENVEEVFTELLNKFPMYLQDKAVVCCLCHGDYRPNNLMVKELNGQVFDIIPVDYQLLNFGSPINDFLYFIYTSTDKAFRKAHLEHLKNVYHESMARFLHYFDINVETVLPKHEFEMVFKQRLDLGLINVILFAPFMFIDTENAPDVSKADWSSSITFNEKYRKRLFEAVEEFTEWGYIKIK